MENPQREQQLTFNMEVSHAFAPRAAIMFNTRSFSASNNQPPPAMAKLLDFLKTALLGGTLVVLPGWLAALSLFKALSHTRPTLGNRSMKIAPLAFSRPPPQQKTIGDALRPLITKFREAVQPVLALPIVGRQTGRIARPTRQAGGRAIARSLPESRKGTDREKQMRAEPSTLHLGVPGTQVFAWGYGVAIRKTKTGCRVRSPAANLPGNAI